ncbi:MAG: hypothetical protein QM496_16010 [Verrucomicrobiota bacterium]
MPRIPQLFGGKDKAEKEAKEAEEKADSAADENVPGNRVVGVVHLVNDRGRFVLVKSVSGGRSMVAAGTTWMTYDANGRPSAKLKVSSERKGAFVVADIVKGSPNRDDSVILHGLMNKKGDVTTVKTPGGEKKQVLE